MDYRRKRRLTFFTIGLIFLLSGIEYAVILPTIWRYLQTLNAAPYFLGLSLSAFSFSGLLAGPLFGFWSDRTLSTKKIILFANVFEMVGNFMYFMGYSRWLLLCSRLVAGIGTGAGSSIFGFLTRNTAPEDRSTVFAAVMACRQAGLLIGPAFNLFLRLCNFQIGPFTVNKYTSPGLFMCLLWILLQFVVLFMYWDFTPQDETRQRNGVEREEVEQEEEEEGKPLVGPNELTGSYGTVTSVQSRASSVANGDVTHVSPLPSLPLRRSTPVLSRTSVPAGTMVTPLTQKFFNFGELENSIMYCVCGVEVIAGFLFVRWLSKRVAERVVLAVGLILCNISCVWCLIFLANPQGGFAWQLAEFIIGVFLQVLGLPFVAVAQVSLFSKITSEKTQGFSQGIRRSVGGLATILGPLWAGGLTFNLYIMLGLMMGLLALLTIMMVVSYERLVAPVTVDNPTGTESED
ncbi:LOW QUALITY PROTEIN: major facilitator superfamily domain-containing protein 8-like [Sinocyclocheilus anshuiensis]|uniref:LOW QUALITY PROTEIN: major facilitator superfamily domain-containing protein 8-like n=1 Tax=Sinocyclocheilus anshuiensis TaxID=1608454 RepID=UPI0007B7A977|nr:PREDICTED: LOW QUALITY PROTEIN: major facilitator superfamily domain-containing protein 8-like [Sinocyclocheilus anshuiensis]